ncbi:mammalian cell entry protein [Mycolicibacterium gadium]|uniref:Mammalian cell entry protein n=1 Tax=Mycolicibacterium gadium TaxID=1794 RepID=A0ABT6H0K3_MYCGU|nr:mammalian cell entry protein [Mycolicibacterium gadium]MDG5486846.1 mammalian cell entry protein [Mycolicibacterium gadium]
MSPRRKFDPGSDTDFWSLRLDSPISVRVLRRSRRRGFELVAILAAITAAAAIIFCTQVLTSHQKHWRTTIDDAAALGFVHSFMTEFTSPDPFHANDYTDRILTHATGDFAEQYRANQNQILVEVARSEPTTGTVLDAGVSRRNDDGSIDMLVVTKLASQSPDGKLRLERANRWVVTAKQEGDRQWKISSLIPMI